MTARPWAHIIAVGDHGLRRGSWYEVLDARDPRRVVLEVAHKRVSVARSCVEMEARRPLAWTVVVTTEDMEFFGSLYGVCPNCVQRSALSPDDLRMTCPACGYDFTIDWSTAS